MSLKKRVAIIGGGVSGLLSSKYALENGLEPIAFEKAADLGGLWKANETAIWPNMRTNVTKYVTSFSDHNWPADAPVYLRSQQVQDHLLSYAEKFALTEHIRFSHSVEFVERLEDQSWRVTFKNLLTNEEKTELFDFLIIASGLYNTPKIPNDKDVDKFKGVIKHSKEFQPNDPVYKSKHVLVVGGCISGIDLSGQLADKADKVTNLFRRTPLIMPLLPRRKIGDNRYSILPLEMFSYSRAETYSSLPMEEIMRQKRAASKKNFPFQADKNPKCPEALHIDFDDLETEIVSGMSEYYIERVKEGRLEPIRSTIERFDENGVYLANGRYIGCDVVLYCTGFKPAFDYLDKSILEAMKYRPEKPKFSYILYKNTFIPGWDTLAFIGTYPRLYFTGYEFQAKWATSVFSGKISLPDRTIMDEYARKLEVKREKDKGAQFPYGPFVMLLDDLARELGILPDFEAIKKSDPELYNYLWNDEVVWSHFLYDKDDYHKNILKEIHEYKTRVYEIETNDVDEIKQAQIEDLFRKYYNFI